MPTAAVAVGSQRPITLSMNLLLENVRDTLASNERETEWGNIKTRRHS